MRILVVDDEENIVTFISKLLTSNGYEIYTAKNGAEAYDIYVDKHVDMIICDEMMPKMTGNELVETIRKENSTIPIIMVTAKNLTYDKGVSFSLGVDDYMVKPIDAAELLMRVNAIFRRAKINTDKQIKVGTVVLDSNTHAITDTANGRTVTLTKTEFELLYKLLSYSEKVFTKWQLYNEFWGMDSERDEGIVKVFIFKIRKQIECFPQIGIKTVMGVGYQGVKNE